jgi:hypothetical protein
VIINKRFEYPAVERVTAPDGKRFYVDPTSDQPLPSVTTILDKTADKGFLVEWEARVGKKKADQIREEAAGLGTLLHTHMECHIQGIARPGGNNLIRQLTTRMADQIIEKAMPRVDEVWGFEIPLWFPGLYAGTTDLVGVFDGKPAIMDYKTTKKMKSRDKITDYFDQTVAYSLAHNEVFGTEIKCGVIFMVSRELEYQTYVLEGEEFDQHVASFLDRVGAYYAGDPIIMEKTPFCTVEQVQPSVSA